MGQHVRPQFHALDLQGDGQLHVGETWEGWKAQPCGGYVLRKAACVGDWCSARYSVSSLAAEGDGCLPKGGWKQTSGLLRARFHLWARRVPSGVNGHRAGCEGALGAG